MSLTDYIQHKYAPGDEVANTFYKRLDDAFGRLAALGAVVALTADSGMNDKSQADGTHKVMYLQDNPAQSFRPVSIPRICPKHIAFLPHYGALGSLLRQFDSVTSFFFRTI